MPQVMSQIFRMQVKSVGFNIFLTKKLLPCTINVAPYFSNLRKNVLLGFKMPPLSLKLSTSGA
jgi:hypothetical protein